MRIPNYIMRETLLEHLLIHGSTGSGKTQLILAPIAKQLIRLAARDNDSSLVVIDQKGDPALFRGIHEEAYRAKLPFRWFTTVVGKSSYTLNPFLQSHFRSGLTTNQSSEMYIKSLGLDHGSGRYGATYFRDLAILLMRTVLRSREVSCFAELAELIARNPAEFDLPKAIQKDTTHLVATLDSLRAVDPLNATSTWADEQVMNNAIDLPEVFSRSQVLYFYLPSTLEDIVGYSIAKLVNYLLLTAASSTPPRERKNVFVIHDEFQRSAGADHAIFLQQARAFNIGCILACQTMSDLEQVERSFVDIVYENTNTHINLTAKSPKLAKYLRESSTKLVGYRASGESSTQFMADDLDANEIKRITAGSQLGTISTAMPRGLTQCGGHTMRFTVDFHIPKEEYERRRLAPWPKVEDCPGTIAVQGLSPEDILVKREQHEKKRAAINLKEAEERKLEPRPETSFQKLARQILRDNLKGGGHLETEN